MRKVTAALVGSALVVALAVPAAARPDFSQGAQPSNQTIVDIVVASSDFDILRTAVIEAGLAGALSGSTQYTVFAPTDGAFKATFRALLGNPDLTEAQIVAFIEAGGVDAAFGDGALANILLYHVTNGRRISPSVLGAPGYRMLNGDWLTRGELVAAGVVPANISAKNGVIHVLTQGVLLP